MSRGLPNLVYLLCTGLIAAVGFWYPVFSDGFAAAMPDGPFYCRELRSSGGDDDAMMLVLVVFVVPFLLRLFRLGESASRLEVVTLWLCITLSVAALAVASMDCAEILYTAFVVPDFVLGGALLAMTFAALLMGPLRRGP